MGAVAMKGYALARKDVLKREKKTKEKEKEKEQKKQKKFKPVV